MYAEFRNSSFYRNLRGNGFSLDKDQEDKIDVQKNSTLVNQEDDTFSDEDSVHSHQSEKKELFSGKKVDQVETSSRSYEILKAGYRNSNRGAVGLGLAGGVVGGVLQGGPGVLYGMSFGSSVGTHLGALSGAIIESYNPSDKKEIADPEERALNAINNRFFGHLVQLSDEAGHHAALGSIAFGGGTVVASLATGNPLPVALHAACLISGATWAFGLTTGSAHWMIQHLQRSQEIGDRERVSSPGDIELQPLIFQKKVTETTNDKDTVNTINISGDQVKES